MLQQILQPDHDIGVIFHYEYGIGTDHRALSGLLRGVRSPWSEVRIPVKEPQYYPQTLMKMRWVTYSVFPILEPFKT